MKLEDFRGRWVLINYWAAWCRPCRFEIPELNALQHAHSEQLVVLGVNFDDPPQDVNREQARDLEISFPVLLSDPGPALGVSPPNALPATLVIAPDGSLERVLVGPQTRASLEEVLFGP